MYGVKWIFVFLLFVISMALTDGRKVDANRCGPEILAVYRVVLETYWTKHLFPKQYPEWRPHAQWSKLVGRSHDNTMTLFRLGHAASQGFQLFAETGKTEALENDQTGAFDEFYASAITTGAGRTEADFFVDGNHTRVSVAAKIIPSPDWFIGLDSINLCKDGRWLDFVTLKVGPMDAGTDNGFTFSAPNWASDPQQRITQITSQMPNHPANSFYYPDLNELPNIATFHFQKMRLYRMQVNTSTPSDVELFLPSPSANEISNDVPQMLPLRVTGEQMQKMTSAKKSRRGKKGYKRRAAIPCKVSDWSSWSDCSQSCGIGESQRRRQVVVHARRGGRPCPPLVETRRCSTVSQCSSRYFRW